MAYTRLGLPWWLSGKESVLQCGRWKRHGFHPWVGKIHWRRTWQLVFLSGKSQRQRSLAGYGPWGHKSRTRLSDEAATATTTYTRQKVPCN